MEEDATTPSATVASASRSHSVSPSPSPSRSFSSRSPSIVGSGGSRNRSITPLPSTQTPIPHLSSNTDASSSAGNTGVHPSVLGASPSHRPLGAPLDSHIADVLQSISLTSSSNSNNRQSHAHSSAASSSTSTLASHAGPATSQQRTIRLITLPSSVSTSSQQKQKHSPRRRKQQQQEVDIDEDEDAQAGKKDERNVKSARTANDGEVSNTSATSSQQSPQLPSPEPILRIPLPSSARGQTQIRASASSSTPDVPRTNSSADPASNMEEDDQSHSSMRHLHKKARHVPIDSNHVDSANDNVNGSPLKSAATDSASASNTVPATSNATHERTASDTSSATAPSVPSAPSSSTGVIKCDICNKLLSSPAQLADHQQGRKHQHMLEIMASGGSLQCTICDKTFTSTLDQSKHMESAGHKANVNFLQQQKDGANVAMLMSPPQRSTSGNVSVASSASSAYSFPANNNVPLLSMQPMQPFPTSSASSSTVSMAPNSGQLFFCPLCRIRTTDSNSLAHHYASRKHMHAIQEAQNQAMRFAQQQPQAAFAPPPPTGSMNPFQNPAQWQQVQMQLYLQQQQQQQMQSANPFSPAPYGMPMYANHGYPPFATGSYPMMNPYSGTPPNDLIHEEEESQPQMDEDSIAAGMQQERQTQQQQVQQLPSAESTDEALTQPETVSAVAVDEVVPNNPSDVKAEREAAPTAARPTASTSAPSTPTIRFLSSSTVTPESVEGLHAEDNTNSSRKRKYGRYSPGFNQRQSNYAGVPRPRLGHSPVQQQLSPFHPHGPPSPQKHPQFSPHHPPPQFNCSCDDPRNFPFSPPLDGMSVASSVSGNSSPLQPEFQQYGPNQCAVHGPHHQPNAGASAVYPQSMPSNWNNPSNAPIAPHPECRAAHYIFVPYPVPVPSNNFPQQPMPSDMNVNMPFNWWPSPFQSGMSPPPVPQPSLPSFHAPFHLPQRSAHELSGMAQHWQQQQQTQPSKRHSNKTHASPNSSSAVVAHHLPSMNPTRTAVPPAPVNP